MLDNINNSKVPLSEHIFQLLRYRIISFETGYRPGDQLNADLVATELGVSRTPVNQAIRRLDYYGLVKIEPRKGTFVTRLTDEEVSDLFQFIAGLEIISVRVTKDLFPDPFLELLSSLVDKAERHFSDEELEEYLETDFQFHREIGCMSPNIKIGETYTSIQNQIYLASAIKALYPGDAQAAFQQHRALIQTFRTRNRSRIEAEIEKHWEDSYHRYLNAEPIGNAQKPDTKR